MKKALLEALFREQSSGKWRKVEEQSEKDIAPLQICAPQTDDGPAAPSYSRQWTYHRYREAHNGDVFHAVLAGIETIPRDLPGTLHRLCSELPALQNVPLPEDDIIKTVVHFLDTASVTVFFTLRPGEKIFNEKEFVDREGNLFRMDKVIVAPAEVTVVDFKSGTESGDYDAQIKNYLRLLGELYPGRIVKGFLAYIKEAEVKQVS